MLDHEFSLLSVVGPVLTLTFVETKDMLSGDYIHEGCCT